MRRKDVEAEVIVASWIKPLLRGLVKELVEEICGAQYTKIAAELELGRNRITQLELELQLAHSRISQLELELKGK